MARTHGPKHVDIDKLAGYRKIHLRRWLRRVIQRETRLEIREALTL
jgi:hypothetical protein